MSIELGNGSDSVTIEGVSTKTTLQAGGGADSVTVAGTLSNIAGDLLIQAMRATIF